MAIPARLRAPYEADLGHDFSRVRVHADAAAARSAKRLGAKAYTVGEQIVFGAGTFSPATAEGRHLLAHELAHVRQQAGGPPVLQRTPDDPSKAAGSGAPPPVVKSAEEKAADAELTARQADLAKLGTPNIGGRVGASTAKTVETLIETSPTIAPFIRSKIAKTTTGANFTIYDFPEEFESTRGKLEPGAAPNTRATTRTYGFYHRKTDSIHLRPDATLGHALHEGVHKYSSAALQSLLGVFVNEGITQHFTDAVLADHSLTGKVGHAYADQLSAAKKLASWVSPAQLGRAYFMGADLTHVVDAVRLKLGLESEDRSKLAAEKDGKALGDRISAHRDP